MQIAMVAAGFSGSEADALRRSMAAWARRGGMEHMRQRLVNGMLERGYQQAFAEQIFEQIKGFGEYGFPESHAASFALLVYVSAWLKCHHPAAFTCALLNSQPMGFYQPAQLVQDARRHGVTVLPADVRYSDWDCALERDTENAPLLRLGLRLIKGLGQQAAERIATPVTANFHRCTGSLYPRATEPAGTGRTGRSRGTQGNCRPSPPRPLGGRGDRKTTGRFTRGYCTRR